MANIPKNKNYGKFTSATTEPEYAKIAHLIDGRQVFNPTDEQYRSLGYKPIIAEETPESVDGYILTVEWKETAEEIVKVLKIEKIYDFNDHDHDDEPETEPETDHEHETEEVTENGNA